LDLIPIDPLPSYVSYQDMADFAAGAARPAVRRRHHGWAEHIAVLDRAARDPARAEPGIGRAPASRLMTQSAARPAWLRAAPVDRSAGYR
jgi:hypothetical protein